MAANQKTVAVEQAPAPKSFYEIERTELLKIGLLGAIAGILIPLLGVVISNYFIEPVFCQSTDNFAICGSGGLVGYYIASVLVAIGAVALLANWGVFRPLLVVLGVTAALWGLKKYVDPLTAGSWLEYYAFSVVLYGLGYLLFYLLVRFRNFALSVVLALVAVVLIRWALLV
ncbi:MAG: hypothetical protein ACREGJ_02445 [Candidatus Saccharimonadales bacterium]